MADASYLIGVCFAAIAVFCVWLGYKMLIPVWNVAGNAVGSWYPGAVGHDVTFVTQFGVMSGNLNVLVQYSFVILMLSVVGMYVVIFAWRKEFGTTSDQEY